MNKNPCIRGDFWLINLDTTVGSEIRKTRPAVIFSRSDYNKAAETLTIIPVSSGRFISSFHIDLSALKNGSHAIIPQIRVAAKKRFIKKIGKATEEEMEEIGQKLAFYLDMF